MIVARPGVALARVARLARLGPAVLVARGKGGARAIRVVRKKGIPTLLGNEEASGEAVAPTLPPEVSPPEGAASK